MNPETESYQNEQNENSPHSRSLNSAETILKNRAKKARKKFDLLILEFSLSGRYFAFEAASIKEVLKFTQIITPVPGLPPSFLGLINVRGEIIPVVDLARILELPYPKESLSTIIILKQNEMIVAFPCETIIQIKPVSQQDIKKEVAAQSANLASISAGCLSKGLVLLDASALLNFLSASLARAK